MPVPDATSAQAIDEYVKGTRIAGGEGPAWHDLRLSVLELPPKAEPFFMPATTEPLIVWTISGQAIAQERENNGPWVSSSLKKGSLYVTAGGAPYEFQWRTLTPERYVVMIVVLSLPLFNEALEDVFGADAKHARLRDVSGFDDPHLGTLLEALREEVGRRTASRLYVRGLGQALAVHLARNYTALTAESRADTSSLPGFKLRRITDWMREHLAEEFSLGRLAQQAEMSEFHFNRLFKRATGIPPSQYQIKLRMEVARRLLRETSQSVITVANEVGYSNPSHFAQVFRKEAGLSPSHYRRES
jgi:AraC family transcriptional regulator